MSCYPPLRSLIMDRHSYVAVFRHENIQSSIHGQTQKLDQPLSPCLELYLHKISLWYLICHVAGALDAPGDTRVVRWKCQLVCEISENANER